MNEDAFSVPGEWLKGNLHLHTTASDGLVTPQEAVELYQGAGYDFLAITDHNTVVDPTELDDLGMTLLPGVEVAPKGGELGQTIHTVAIGLDECPPDPGNDDPQPYISEISALSQFCFVAHPSWSSLTFRDILDLKGIYGLEVYNTVCHHGIGRGVSEVQWDDLLVRGRRLHGLAVDDAHHKYEDRFYGRIMLKAADREPESIYAALRAGHFYATTGPIIESVEFEGDVIRIESSPCVEFFAICPQPGRGQGNWREGVFGEVMTSCELHLSPDHRPVRIVVVDEQGRRAWSNPWYAEE
ncbi:MAG: PHP domain-containing protein [Armatimonadetes bacterium]|nr:PHP domain-containing protein [Armatimonadota bacterium]